MRQRGFTLVELLVALAIFSVLGLASWQVLHQVIQTKQTLAERSTELRQLQKTLWFFTQDLHAIVDRPVRDNYGTLEPAVSSVIPGFTLVFTRNGWMNPLQLQRSELQRVAYGVEEAESGKRLVRYSWPVLDRAPKTEPVKQVLLDAIERLEIQFLDSRGQAAFYWPPSSTAQEETELQPTVPSGIRLRLSIPAWGEVERVIQLRDVTPS